MGSRVVGVGEEQGRQRHMGRGETASNYHGHDMGHGHGHTSEANSVANYQDSRLNHDTTKNCTTSKLRLSEQSSKIQRPCYTTLPTTLQPL